MAKKDPILGQAINQKLVNLGLETPMIKAPTPAVNLIDSFRAVLSDLGLDLSDDSLQDTPQRVAKMYAEEIFYGLNYDNFPKCSVFKNKMQYDELVCGKNILVRSVCEHHLVPFIGTATVAYIPNTNVVGLSKLNRVVDFFCRRPQVQERLTAQVHAALCYVLDTKDVAVVIDAEHFCVKLRGVMDPSSSTVTSKISGKFKEIPELRAEFLTLTKEK